MSNSDGGEALWRHEFMSSELQRVREKTLIVNTLDGFLYGFKGSQLIWTKAPIWAISFNIGPKCEGFGNYLFCKQPYKH
jgi:hypothetical protein